MQKLAKREEQIMNVFWQLGQAFIRDIIPLMPAPKPHYNSLSTMVKILEDKNFLKHTAVGNTFLYYPVISKEDYQKYAVKDFVSRYFDNSLTNMVSFFVKDHKISDREINDIMNLIKAAENDTL